MNSTQHYLPVSQYVSQELTARDEELVRAAIAGSHAAFAELQSLYAPRLYKRTLSITKNREDAEDALQDAFLRAYRALPSFQGRSKFSSWLTRIAINSALMVIRKRRARPETACVSQSGVEEDAIVLEVRDTAPNPEQVWDQRERAGVILRAIQRLDVKMRDPLHIWISQEHSISEIAEDLGISSASVKSRLHRARQRLAKSPALRNLKMEVIPADRGNLRLLDRAR